MSSLRSMRIDGERWDRWKAAAVKLDVSLTDLIIDSVEAYIATPEKLPPRRLVKPVGHSYDESLVPKGDLGSRDVTPRFKKDKK